jgi:hypothetical protein
MEPFKQKFSFAGVGGVEDDELVRRSMLDSQVVNDSWWIIYNSSIPRLYKEPVA